MYLSWFFSKVDDLYFLLIEFKDFMSVLSNYKCIQNLFTNNAHEKLWNKKNSIWNHEVKVNEIVIRVSYCTFIVLFGKSFSFSTVECESQSLYFCISVLVLVSKYESKSNINEGLLKHYFRNIIYKNYIICFFLHNFLEHLHTLYNI